MAAGMSLRELYGLICAAVAVCAPFGLAESAILRQFGAVARPSTILALVASASRRGHVEQRSGRVYVGPTPYKEVYDGRSEIPPSNVPAESSAG